MTYANRHQDQPNLRNELKGKSTKDIKCSISKLFVGQVFLSYVRNKKATSVLNVKKAVMDGLKIDKIFTLMKYREKQEDSSHDRI